MRRAVDFTILASVIAVAGLVWFSRPAAQTSADHAAAVQASLERLYARTAYHAALDHRDGPRGTLWPAAVLPTWFQHDLPTNALLPDADTRPWLDVAPPGDKHLHPPDPIAYRRDQAQFWYNPNLGIFRARLAAHLGETRALALYNQLHSVELTQLQRHADPARTPLTYIPGQTPRATLASGHPDEAASTITVRENLSAPAPTPRPAHRPSLFRPAGAFADRDITPPPDAPAHAAADPVAPRPGRARLRDH